MSIVTDFKSIKQILDRQEQKADFEEKNQQPTTDPAMYGWPYAIATTGAVPFVTDEQLEKLTNWIKVKI